MPWMNNLRIGALLLWASSPVMAASEAAITFEQGKALALQNACLGCHQVDAKRVGPGFTQVAQRHSGQPGMVDYLANRIRQGGRGQWGAIPMPAQNQVTDTQAKQLAQWILSLEP